MLHNWIVITPYTGQKQMQLELVLTRKTGITVKLNGQIKRSSETEENVSRTLEGTSSL